jgi:hypothetical protein
MLNEHLRYKAIKSTDYMKKNVYLQDSKSSDASPIISNANADSEAPELPKINLPTFDDDHLA